MNLINFEITMSPFGQAITLHPTVIQDKEEMFLIDCGYAGSLELLSEQMALHQLSMRDLTGIIISHDDIDHVGGLFEIRKAYPAVRIYASAIEAPYISGEQKSLRLRQAEDMFPSLPQEHRSWALEFQRSLQSIKRVPVDALVDIALLPLENITIIPTPGHTPGHISLYIPNTRTLIANDALVVEQGELEIANPSFTLDIKEAIASIEKLSSLEIDTLYCYHGGIVVDRVSQKIEKLLSKYTGGGTQYIQNP